MNRETKPAEPTKPEEPAFTFERFVTISAFAADLTEQIGLMCRKIAAALAADPNGADPKLLERLANLEERLRACSVAISGNVLQIASRFPWPQPKEPKP
jgi:hypothetical protein